MEVPISPDATKYVILTLRMYEMLIMVFKNQKDYLREFMERVNDLLAAWLSREALPSALIECPNCDGHKRATWRCTDCLFARPLCRGCMRAAHIENPLHRIQKWTGKFYRPAELWEVGTYLLVRHHDGEPMCDALRAQHDFQERMEVHTDDAEQAAICRQTATTDPHRAADDPTNTGPPMNDITVEEEEREMFVSNVQNLRASVQDADDDAILDGDGIDDEDDFQPDNETGDAESDHYLAAVEHFAMLHPVRGGQYRAGGETREAQGENTLRRQTHTADPTTGQHDGVQHPEGADYAQNEAMPSQPSSDDSVQPIPSHDLFDNAYVRVVHTNGLHHLGMISCRCRGSENLAMDLVACQLIPASFYNIRTLFSTQAMDYFRLCNLELKASAYQFYQLLRRLTKPMAPAEVVDLYNEFRRMSRFWRWMKKLKWAGYGQNGKHHSDVAPGALGNFCPACPQPGKNLPADWKADADR